MIWNYHTLEVGLIHEENYAETLSMLSCGAFIKMQCELQYLVLVFTIFDNSRGNTYNLGVNSQPSSMNQ